MILDVRLRDDNLRKWGAFNDRSGPTRTPVSTKKSQSAKRGASRPRKRNQSSARKNPANIHLQDRKQSRVLRYVV